MIAIDMEMPKSCGDCPIRICDFEHCEMCGLINKEINYLLYILHKNRHPDCPLIELDGKLEHEINVYQYECKLEKKKYEID